MVLLVKEGHGLHIHFVGAAGVAVAEVRSGCVRTRLMSFVHSSALDGEKVQLTTCLHHTNQGKNEGDVSQYTVLLCRQRPSAKSGIKIEQSGM